MQMPGRFFCKVFLLITFLFSTDFYSVFCVVETFIVERWGIVENLLIPAGWF